ncbi:ParB/RepB/Spo0J family partition protein [Thermosyntropha sp.]|uniref:ParB/RepB/Spo0J family partition protein n=1 Tax=Thermosyntropha sp. TaxID=2740820 RepID=UPI0025E5E552|nr:ParB/RepB/Spo0J family partition protein [Thermosyntropha sp.]MBO8159687.1 ParB/RepB/Spo0J family partition protein [Thermosyntropha sp.]
MLYQKINKMWGKISDESVIYVPLSRIIRSPFHPRRNFDKEGIYELAQSIRLYGVIEPVILRQEGDFYQLIAGERRYQACLLLGLSEIPAIVKDIDDEKAALIPLIENLQKKSLNFFEEADAYRMLCDVFGLSRDDIVRKTGSSKSVIADKLLLANFSPEVRNKIISSGLNEDYAQILLKVNSPRVQIEIIDRICEKGLTLREAERLVDKISENKLLLEDKGHNTEKNVSMVIRDARIFLNTIKETVKRAKQTGINIYMEENNDEESYELVIRVAKKRPFLRQILSS